MTFLLPLLFLPSEPGCGGGTGSSPSAGSQAGVPLGRMLRVGVEVAGEASPWEDGMGPEAAG